MMDLEYMERRLTINGNVVNELITLIGYALPHTQPQLRELLKAWDGAIERLDADRKLAESTPPETK